MHFLCDFSLNTIKRHSQGLSVSSVTTKGMHFFSFYILPTFSYESPAVNADRHIVLLLEHMHVLQNLKNRGDGVWYTVIRPVHIVQLLQCARRLGVKKGCTCLCCSLEQWMQKQNENIVSEHIAPLTYIFHWQQLTFLKVTFRLLIK